MSVQARKYGGSPTRKSAFTGAFDWVSDGLIQETYDYSIVLTDIPKS